MTSGSPWTSAAVSRQRTGGRRSEVHGQDSHPIAVPAIKGSPPFTGDIEPLSDPHQFSCCTTPLKRSGAPALSREFCGRQHEGFERWIRRHASTVTAGLRFASHRRRYVDRRSHPGLRDGSNETPAARHRHRRRRSLYPIATCGPDKTGPVVAFGSTGRNRARKGVSSAPPTYMGTPASSATPHADRPPAAPPPCRSRRADPIAARGPDCDRRTRQNRLRRRFRVPGTQPGPDTQKGPAAEAAGPFR